MASQQEPYYTPEEYLALERESETKHEYLDGRIYAMTGARRSHIRIVGNVYALLHTQLRGRPCEAFGSDMMIRVAATGLHTYPDVSTLCGKPEFAADRRTGVLLNPSVLVEVLSPSTESYDRGDKFRHYRQIPSLEEYVLIAQDEMHAERFTRGAADGTRWVLTQADGPDVAVELRSVGCVLRLRDVYERVELPPKPPLRPVYEHPAMAGYASDARV